MREKTVRLLKWAAPVVLVLLAACGWMLRKEIKRSVKRTIDPVDTRGDFSAAGKVRDHGFVSFFMVTPTIGIVTARGADVSDWTSGWQATAGGKPVDVSVVGRWSIPVAQPGYSIGFGKDDDLSVIWVEHRIALEFAQPLGQSAKLKLNNAEGSFDIDFRDDRTLTPLVQLNQVGYSDVSTHRYAYLSYYLGDRGGLSPEQLPQTVELCLLGSDDGVRDRRSLVTKVRATTDADAGSAVAEVDLSSVAPGSRFFLRVPGVGRSYVTSVGSGPEHAFRVLMAGLLHNRWGVELDASFSKWPRPADHPKVFTSERENAYDLFSEAPPKQGERTLKGGYHDAGDFDQRPSHTVVAQLLMRAYGLAPQYFTDGQLPVPERDNGIPDLLDEALWGIAAWEQLQEEDGGVRGGVESTRHPWGIYFASDDALDYWTFARDPDVTARAAGLFAQAARLLAPFDAEHAKKLTERAKRASDWAQTHGAKPGFELYAASALYRLTGEAKYKTRFESLWQGLGPEGAFNRFAAEQLSLSDYAKDARVMTDFFVDYLLGPSPDEKIVKTARRWLVQESNTVAQRVLESKYGHRNPRRVEDNIGWGAGTVMGRYLDPIMAALRLGYGEQREQQRWIDAISLSADYVLGANPAGMVYITGLGFRSPREPLHLDSLVWLKKGKPPVPGIPVYGPSSDVPGHAWYKHGLEAMHPSYDELPRMRRYVDIRTFVVNSEFTVWETQAPHAAHFAVLSALKERVKPAPAGATMDAGASI